MSPQLQAQCSIPSSSVSIRANPMGILGFSINITANPPGIPSSSIQRPLPHLKSRVSPAVSHLAPLEPWVPPHSDPTSPQHWFLFPASLISPSDPLVREPRDLLPTGCVGAEGLRFSLSWGSPQEIPLVSRSCWCCPLFVDDCSWIAAGFGVSEPCLDPAAGWAVPPQSLPAPPGSVWTLGDKIGVFDPFQVTLCSRLGRPWRWTCPEGAGSAPQGWISRAPPAPGAAFPFWNVLPPQKH